MLLRESENAEYEVSASVIPSIPGSWEDKELVDCSACSRRMCSLEISANSSFEIGTDFGDNANEDTGGDYDYCDDVNKEIKWGKQSIICYLSGLHRFQYNLYDYIHKYIDLRLLQPLTLTHCNRLDFAGSLRIALLAWERMKKQGGDIRGKIAAAVVVYLQQQ